MAEVSLGFGEHCHQREGQKSIAHIGNGYAVRVGIDGKVGAFHVIIVTALAETDPIAGVYVVHGYIVLRLAFVLADGYIRCVVHGSHIACMVRNTEFVK